MASQCIYWGITPAECSEINANIPFVIYYHM